MSQETNTLKFPPLKTLQSTPSTLSLESLLIFLLKIGYDINADDIERVKMYGHAMFEDGCCTGAEAAADMLKAYRTKAAPSSPSIN